MRGQTPLALCAILLAAVETAGGLQELMYLGILQSETEPLIMGALGTAGGAMLLPAGIAFLLRSPRTEILVPAAAYIALPVYLMVGVIKHYAAWPITTVGTLFPLLLKFLWHRFARTDAYAEA